jgi:hypothetical protein
MSFSDVTEYCSFVFFQSLKNIKAIVSSLAIQKQALGQTWVGRDHGIWLFWEAMSNRPKLGGASDPACSVLVDGGWWGQGGSKLQ